MYVINIALRRSDGKVENDTLYGDKEMTMADLQAISEKHNCDVIVSHVGQISFFGEPDIKEKTLVYNRPEQKEKKEDDKPHEQSEICDDVQSTSSPS